MKCGSNSGEHSKGNDVHHILTLLFIAKTYQTGPEYNRLSHRWGQSIHLYSRPKVQTRRMRHENRFSEGSCPMEPFKVGDLMVHSPGHSKAEISTEEEEGKEVGEDGWDTAQEERTSEQPLR